MPAEQEARENAEAEKKFVEPRDLLHLGNIDGYILEDIEQGRNAYNDQMIKYNSKFSQLVGKLHSNVNEIDKIVS